MLKPDTLALTAVLALITALGPLSTDMYLPSLPAIAAGLEATTGQTQLTLSAFLLGFAAGQFFYGPISDRIGRKPVLLFGLGLFTLASLICALSPNIETLIGARFLQALGASGPIVLGRAIVRDFYEGPRAVAHGHDHGRGAGGGSDPRRRHRALHRLARDLRRDDPVRTGAGGRHRVAHAGKHPPEIGCADLVSLDRAG